MMGKVYDNGSNRNSKMLKNFNKNSQCYTKLDRTKFSNKFIKKQNKIHINRPIKTLDVEEKDQNAKNTFGLRSHNKRSKNQCIEFIYS